jgi:hypothetical protein
MSTGSFLEQAEKKEALRKEKEKEITIFHRATAKDWLLI